jgi:hypothetical protein
MIGNEMVRYKMMNDKMISIKMIRNEEGRWMKEREERMKASQNQRVENKVIAK